MSTLADNVRAYLIAQSIVRDPRVAGALPPCWRQPIDGTPAPGEGSNNTEVGQTIVVGLSHSGGVPTPRFEKDWRRDIIDIWIRTVTWPQTESVYSQIRTALIDKTNWHMGAMTVIESEEWRALALIDSNLAQGFTSQCAVLFESYAADHF